MFIRLGSQATRGKYFSALSSVFSLSLSMFLLPMCVCLMPSCLLNLYFRAAGIQRGVSGIPTNLLLDLELQADKFGDLLKKVLGEE